MRTNCDITIYNKYVDSSTRSEKFQRAEVRLVSWQDRKASNVRATGGYAAANQATLYVPFLSGVNHLDPVAWQSLTTKTGKWTIQVEDIVVKGIVSDEIREASTDPVTHVVTLAFTPSDLKEKYDSVLFVTSVDKNDQGSYSLQHWQVGAN